VVTIKQIDKNSKEVIRIQKKNYKDTEYIDIRTWIKTYDENEFVPTKKGITLQLDKLAELEEILKEVKNFPTLEETL